MHATLINGVHQYVYIICVCMYMHWFRILCINNNYKILIGVHEMYDRMHPNYDLVISLLAHDPPLIVGLLYDQPHPSRSGSQQLPINTLVARWWPARYILCSSVAMLIGFVCKQWSCAWSIPCQCGIIVQFVSLITISKPVQLWDYSMYIVYTCIKFEKYSTIESYSWHSNVQ